MKNKLKKRKIWKWEMLPWHLAEISTKSTKMTKTEMKT